MAVSREKEGWKKFWDANSLKLLLYSCQYGTVEIVKYFITRHVPPTICNGLSPLSTAAKAGKYDIVAYLLSIPGVPLEGNESSLMLASKYGHAKCVQLLLKKNADVKVVSDRNYNCLMESIKRGHKSVAIALLNDKTWKASMQLCVPERREDDGKNRLITPMRMLIELMPGVSKLVLTKCTKPPTDECVEVVYDFQFIEDYVESAPEQQQTALLPTLASGVTATDDSDIPLTVIVPETSERQQRTIGTNEGEKKPLMTKYIPLDHPLSLMVKHERLDLLKHPLIQRYIYHKWWKLSFPVFLTILIFYTLFLIFLVSFGLSIPRPGPDSKYCPSNELTVGYTFKNPDVVDQIAFTVLAVTLILMSTAFVIYEIIFYRLTIETKHFSDHIELFFRIMMFVLTVVFVFGFANDCWCAPPWQWQIGALVMFMAFFNLVLMLKRMPLLGVPINMLLNIIIEFLKLVYLPILLILCFAFTFYMLFVREGDADAGVLTAFSTFLNSLTKVIMQTAGELDFGTIFEEGPLLYTHMAIFLFITFVVIMPILFNNLLVGLAVGTAETDTKKAELTNIRLQVEYIIQLEKLAVVRHKACLPKLTYLKDNKRSWFQTWRDKKMGVDYNTQAKLVHELHDALQDLDKHSKETAEEMKDTITEMASMIESLQMSMSLLQKSHKNLQDNVIVTHEKLQEKLDQLKEKLKIE